MTILGFQISTSTGSERFLTQPLKPISVPKKYQPSTTSGPNEFTEYESYNLPGWDGFDAQAISAETIHEARNFALLLPRELRSADIAPGADGTIGFEWRTGSGDQRVVTIVDIGPGDRVVARRLSSTGKTVEYAVTKVRTGAAALIGQLF
jgi:hypothetical protein